MTDVLDPAALALLACTHCAGPVRQRPGAVACDPCSRAWPVDHGVPCFGQSSDFPADFSRQQACELLEVAERAGWQVALHDHMRLLDETRYRQAVDEYRAQWRCLLPLSPGSRVLDLRCGWGPIAISLAAGIDRLVAADVRYEAARFAALRAGAQGLDNVGALSLDPAQRLPFADGAFDGVVLHEVVEWMRPNRLLAEAARVLAPSGWLFVAAPNRLNVMRLLRGARAAASSAQACSQTLHGYRRALARAGFSRQAAFGLLPSASEPFYVVNLEHRLALRYFLDGLFAGGGLRAALAKRNLLAPYLAARSLWRAGRLLPVESLVRYLTPGYGLLAYRSANSA